MAARVLQRVLQRWLAAVHVLSVLFAVAAMLVAAPLVVGYCLLLSPMHYYDPAGFLPKPLVGMVALVVGGRQQVLPGGPMLLPGRSTVVAGLSVLVRSLHRVVEASLKVSVVCVCGGDGSCLRRCGL